MTPFQDSVQFSRHLVDFAQSVRSATARAHRRVTSQQHGEDFRYRVTRDEPDRNRTRLTEITFSATLTSLLCPCEIKLRNRVAEPSVQLCCDNTRARARTLLVSRLVLAEAHWCPLVSGWELGARWCVRVRAHFKDNPLPVTHTVPADSSELKLQHTHIQRLCWLYKLSQRNCGKFKNKRSK